MADSKNILREMFVKIGLIGDKDAKEKIGRFRKAINAIVGDLKVFKANLSAIAVTSLFRGISRGFSLVIGKTRELFVESARLAGQQEEVERRLESSLRIAGKFSNLGFQGLKDFANALQEASIFGDEEILEGLSLSVALGASVEQAKQLVQAAADYSSLTGRSFQEAVRQTAKTLGGYAGELGEIIPALKELTQDELRAGKAAELMAKQFGGASLDRINTFTGSMSRLMGVVGDSLQVVGKQLIQVINPALVRFRSYLKDLAPDFSSLGNKMAQVFQVMLRMFDSLGGKGFLKDIVKFVGDAFLDIALLVEDLVLFLSGKESFLGRILKSGNLVENITEKLTGLVKEITPPIIKGVVEGIGDLFKGIWDGLMKGMVEGIFSITEKVIEKVPFIGTGLRMIGEYEMAKDQRKMQQNTTNNNNGGNVIYITAKESLSESYEFLSNLLTGAGQTLETRGSM